MKDLLSSMILLFLAGYFVSTIGENFNIALGKNVSASSYMTDRPPEKAVDGDRVASQEDKVFHTLYGQSYSITLSWWSVDLGLEVIFPQVVIYFRTDNLWRRNGVRISLSPVDGGSNYFCHVVTGAADGSDIPEIYNFTCPARGRYLNISTVTNNNDDVAVILDFGEVEVYARTAGEVNINTKYIPLCHVSVSFLLEPVDMALVVELEEVEVDSRIECMLKCEALDLCVVFEYQSPTCTFWRVGSSGLTGTRDMWKKKY